MNLNTTKLEELLATLKKKEEEKDKNTVLWVLAIIGAVAAVAGIAFAVYRFFAPDYLEDFEEDFEAVLNRSEWLSVMYEYEMRIIEAPARYRGLIFEHRL